MTENSSMLIELDPDFTERGEIKLSLMPYWMQRTGNSSTLVVLYHQNIN